MIHSSIFCDVVAAIHLSECMYYYNNNCQVIVLAESESDGECAKGPEPSHYFVASFVLSFAILLQLCQMVASLSVLMTSTCESIRTYLEDMS